MLSPARRDQVRPVAEKNSTPTSSHSPSVACKWRNRELPAAAAVRLRLTSHNSRPPNAATHSQDAASSL